jgi:hypothetical protein
MSKETEDCTRLFFQVSKCYVKKKSGGNCPQSPNDQKHSNPAIGLLAAAHRTHIHCVEFIDIVDETVEEVDAPPDAGISGDVGV